MVYFAFPGLGFNDAAPAGPGATQANNLFGGPPASQPVQQPAMAQNQWSTAPPPGKFRNKYTYLEIYTHHYFELSLQPVLEAC